MAEREMTLEAAREIDLERHIARFDRKRNRERRHDGHAAVVEAEPRSEDSHAVILRQAILTVEAGPERLTDPRRADHRHDVEPLIAMRAHAEPAAELRGRGTERRVEQRRPEAVHESERRADGKAGASVVVEVEAARAEHLL